MTIVTNSNPVTKNMFLTVLYIFTKLKKCVKKILEGWGKKSERDEE